MDLREFAYDVKDTLLAEFLQRHIVLIVKLDESYPTFYGDPIRLKQACINLLKNAMESITGLREDYPENLCSGEETSDRRER